MGDAPYTIRIAKEDFKFSAAHFTIFRNGTSELLHGHNYRVRLVLSGEQLDENGFLLDIAELKRHVRKICARYDEYTLVPEKNPLLEVRVLESKIEMRIGEHEYLLPQQDVVLLPLVNLTVELLAKHIWQEIYPAVVNTSVKTMEVEIEETAGQSCSYAASVVKAREEHG